MKVPEESGENMNKREGMQLLTQSETARFLGRSVRTLSSWRRKGYGPAFHRIGGAVMYGAKDLNEFLSSSRVRPRSDYRLPNTKREEEPTACRE
jgi:Helix-turn-helix domain